MNIPNLQLGNYVNFFQVNLANEELNLLHCSRDRYSSLDGLREQLRESYVYAEGRFVYGYGDSADELTVHGFTAAKRKIDEVPGLVSRMILEGFMNALSRKGFKIEWHKIRVRAFNPHDAIELSIPEVKIYMGCEVRSTFLATPEEGLMWGLIIDLKYKYKIASEPETFASFKNIRNFVALKHGHPAARSIIKEIKVKTGDLTPYGKINQEASESRFRSILKIVNSVGEEFTLPNGSKARLSLVPTRVILEGRYE